MKYDVIVCGAGPSGMTAAISARRNNAKVLLIEASGLLGGNSILSLVGPWMTFHNNGKQIVKGIGSEIVERLVDKGYSLGHIKDPIGFADSITPVDVEGVKEVYFDYISEEGIDLLLHSFICEVIKENNVLKGVKVATKSGFINLFADIIIDATGDGDVSSLAGCEFVYGREKDGLAQPLTMLFSVANVNIEVLKSFMKENEDDCVVAENYDYGYLAISGFFKKIQEAKDNNEFSLPRDRVLLFQDVRENQVSINMTRVQNLSAINVFDLTASEIEGRAQIKKAFKFLKKYIPGFENSYIIRTPYRIGVRETRHIIGEYILQVDDILKLRSFEDSICLSAFPIDIHSPSEENLELFEQSVDKCYEIPLRVMIPKEIDNLIVTGRCLSATHEANASVRVTPSVMALGEAAGVLAALSFKHKKAPRSIDYKLVQDALINQGQIFKKEHIN
jgi:hypothetical protein